MIERKSLVSNISANSQIFSSPIHRQSITKNKEKQNDIQELKVLSDIETPLNQQNNYFQDSSIQVNDQVKQTLSLSQNKNDISSSVSIEEFEDFQKEQEAISQQAMSLNSNHHFTSTNQNNINQQNGLGQNLHFQQKKSSYLFSSLQNSPKNSTLYSQINQQLKKQAFSPSKKLQKQADHIQKQIKQSKKQEIHRYFGYMYKEVQLLKLQPQMQERKMTYRAFHQSDSQKKQVDSEFQKKKLGINQNPQKKQSKRGLMYTNELWSEPYYLKIFKTSQLDQIENKINTEKRHQTVKESVDKLSDYFKSLANPQEDYNKLQGLFSRKKISLKQDDLLKNYIQTQVSYENQLHTQRQQESFNEDYSKNKKGLKHQNSIFSESQNKQNSFHSNNLQSPQMQDSKYVLESPKMTQITSINSFLNNKFSQKEQKQDTQDIQEGNSQINDQNSVHNYQIESKPQQDLYLNEQDLTQSQSQFNNDKLKQFNLKIKNPTFFHTHRSNGKKFYEGSLTARNSDKKQIEMIKKGFETSRNNSLEQSTKSSPFFQSLKNSRTSSIYNSSPNKEKLELSKKNSDSKINQASPFQYNQQKRFCFDGSFLSKKLQNFQDNIIEKDNQKFRENINYILQECQKIQNESNQIKHKINLKMKESQIYNQVQLKILRMRQQKKLLQQFNFQTYESRDQIDQRRKEINTYQFVREDVTQKLQS